MPEVGGGARLSDLESRWRFDRSPRVFLQLADELRRTGSLARAIEVLQEGLSHHPESVSGRVALGRAQLEAGDASAAAATLERVLARDPAQIVASKLLIEAWIRMGDATRARERLDIYRILQERDSEIDDYERRIAAMERSERLPVLIELVGASVPAAVLTGAREAGYGTDAEPLFDLGPANRLPPLELLPEVESGSTARSESSPAMREPVAASRSTAVPVDSRSPFGLIHEPGAGGARILNFFRSEAIFPLRAAEPVAAAEPAAPEQIAAEPVVAAVPEPIDQAVAAGELAPGMTFEQFSTTGFAAEVERESLAEPLSDVLSRAGLDAEALPAIAHPVEAAFSLSEPVAATEEPLDLARPGADERFAAAADSEAATAFEGEREAPVPAGRSQEAPSATLARLYLDQGHLTEAEAEFRRVLEARPDDESALSGLRDVARRRASDETVSGWGVVAPIAPGPSRAHRAIGLTQRKIETLRAYLERIRRTRARANVS